MRMWVEKATRFVIRIGRLLEVALQLTYPKNALNYKGDFKMRSPIRRNLCSRRRVDLYGLSPRRQ